MSDTNKQIEIVPEFVKRAIENEVEKATQEELTEAQRRIEKRKAEIVASVMLTVQKRMTIETLGETIKFVIEIK